MIICLEGIDGSGKSTVVKHLMDLFGKKAVQLRTPGFIPEIRELVLNPERELHNETKAILFLAEMVEVSHQMRKYHDSGIHVILDRFYLSTYVYQFYKMYPYQRRVCEYLIKNFMTPIDITAILKLPVKVAMERTGAVIGEFSEKDAFEKDSWDEWERRANLYNSAHLMKNGITEFLGKIMFFNAEKMTALEISKAIHNYVGDK